MKNYLFTITLCTTALAFSQTDYEKRQAQNKVDNERLNTTYTNNLPNKSGSNVRDVSQDIRIARENYQKKEYEYAKYQEEMSDMKAWMKNYEEQKKLDHAAHVEAVKNQQYPFLQYIRNKLPNVNLYDKVIWYDDHLFVNIEGPKPKYFSNHEATTQNFAGATTAIEVFQTVKETATFDDLAKLVFEGKLLFFTNNKNLKYLYTRFPERKADIELIELQLLPYFFGANRTYLQPIYDKDGMDTEMYYPSSSYEIADKPEKQEMVNRFLELNKKYPQQGEEALKLFRRHLNPYIKYVQLMDAYANYDRTITEIQNEMYLKAIHSKITGSDAQTAFASLIQNNAIHEKLKQLTPEDWIMMAEEQQYSVGSIWDVQIYLKNKGWINLGERYKNLDKAKTIWNKEITKKVRQEMRDERKKAK